MKSFKAGQYVSQGSYSSFQPGLINRQWIIDDPAVQSLLSKADRNIGRLDMFSQHIPNVDLFISMHVVKEATQSSKIEGTQTNIEEALQTIEDVSPEKRDDWQEVQNYISALNQSIEALSTLPLSSRLIRNTHKTLLHGVRGEHKLPGDFRRSQNWIGGASIADAAFIPPIHETVPEYMSDLEKFIHNDSLKVPELIKAAIIHYQFETIHPFLDGNGRVGRLLITLYLVWLGMLKRPVLYLSDFFEKNRKLYYDNLMNVRSSNDILSWIKFFLVGVTETAEGAVRTFDRVLAMKEELETKVQNLGQRAGHSMKLLLYLFEHPTVNAQVVSSVTGYSLPSAYSLITEFERLGILHEVTGGQRGKYYLFQDYINLFK